MCFPTWHSLSCTIQTYLPAALAVLIVHCGDPHNAGSEKTVRSLPRLMLWVWERREDLSFINPRDAGVAFLATTIRIRTQTIDVQPRLQSFQVPPTTVLMAVTRIEISPDEHPLLSWSQRQKVIETISRTARVEGVRAVQVDFDARQSERLFYADLLKDLRTKLPDTIALSMTALCSWCMFDSWISDVHADEIVPMYFRMGRDSTSVRTYMQRNGSFPEIRCRGSIGISTDEPGPDRYGEQRIYVFSPERWTKEMYLRVSQEMIR